MKKAISILSLMLVLVLVIAACGPTAPPATTTVADTTPTEQTPPPPPPPPPPVHVPVTPEPLPEEWLPNDGNPATIRVAWWGGDARHEAMQAALQIYMDRYPNITIETEFGAFSGWMDNMMTQIGGGVAPDIMQVNYAWVHAFGPGGTNVFADLRDWGHIIDLTEWGQELLTFTTTSDGELAGVPHGMTGRVMVYNRHMLNEYGLTEFPTTWEALIEYGTIVAEGNTALDQGNNTYVFFPLGPESLDIILLQYLYNETGKNLEENRQMLHTVEEVQAVYELIGHMIETGTIPTFEQQEPPHDSTNPVWMQGRGGSSFEWVSNIFLSGGNFMDNDLEGLGVALLPAGPSGGQLTMQRPSLVYTISRDSNYPEVAAHVFNFLFTDEEALMTIGAQLGVPFFRSGVEIAERDGQIVGLMAEGVELLNANMAPMGPTFENAALREPRFAIMEEFRLGLIDAHTAAQRFISEQQAALNAL